MSLLVALAFVVGCGGSAEKTDKNFFTSGNREADQRADQRMAKAAQLTGDTNNGGQKVSTSQAVISTEKKALYDRLGGQQGIQAIVDDYVPRVLDDPRVNWSRKGITRGGLNPLHRGDSVSWDPTNEHVKLLKLHLVQFLELSTGGPANYGGKDIRQSHQNMHITNPEFDAAVGDLKATLDRLQIANQEQKELLSIVESTREQIVTER
ncbi:MAG: group 1 truncated hemoglobin [Phycisphaerae bacterium]|nr:group 1 truncated hemoglobin [Phycisphaerae bacterium]